MSSEDILKESAAALGVPVPDVPKVIKNMLGEIAAMDAEIKQLSG